MTLLGLLLVLFAAAGVLWFRAAVVPALVGASLSLNDSAALVGPGFVVSPFYLATIVLAVRLLSRGSRRHGGDASYVLLALLVVYGVISAVVAPKVFAGTGVIAAGVGLDQQVSTLTPLTGTSSNLAQAAYLLLAAGYVWCSASREQEVQRTLRWALAFGVALGVAVYLFTLVGFDLTGTLFDNSPRNFYAVGELRFRGQFSEPSHLGTFAVAAAGYFVMSALRGSVSVRRTGVDVVLSAAAVFLAVQSGSGTAVGAAAISTFVLALTGLGVWAHRRFALSHRGIMITVAALPVLILATPVASAYLQGVVEQKLGSSSQVNRSQSNQIALDVFHETNLLGAGLGSDRASSLLFYLLANIGIAGTVLVCLVAAQALVRLARKARFDLFACLVVLLAALFFSQADFASPLLWVLLAAGFAGFVARVPQVPRIESPAAARA